MKGLSRYAVPPGSISRVIISHDHWDHTGGLNWVLTQHPDATVFIGKHAGDTVRRLVRHDRIVDVTMPVELAPELYLLGEMPGKHNGHNVFEIPLVAGDTLITGCAHPGIVRIVEHAVRLGKKVTKIVGGLHMMDACTEEIDDTIRKLKDLGIQHAAPCHCTGARAVRRFRKAFGKHCCVVKGSGEIVFREK